MIRQADRWDIPNIIELLKNYRTATPWDRLSQCDNENYIIQILTHILTGAGVIFVSEKEKSLLGILIAVKNINMWDPTIVQLDEIAYWVEPEHRGGTVGYRLIKQYVDYAQELKDAGQIEAYTISKMVNSPDLKYNKFGFEKLEEKWMVK